MNRSVISLITSIVLLATGCASPPKFVKPGHAPFLDKNGGVVVLIDACIERENFISDNYVILAETKAASKILEKSVQKYLLYHGIKVRATLVPFLCGALPSSVNSTLKVALDLNSRPKDGKQPFDIAENFSKDPIYLHAMIKISTYARQHTAFARNYLTSQDEDEDYYIEPIQIISNEQFKKAAAVVAEKTQASLMLYIGLLGKSSSGGQKAADVVGRVLLAAVSPITALISSDNDNGLITAALINLENKEVPWSNATQIHGGPDIFANYSILAYLLSRLVTISATEWSPPGTPPDFSKALP